MAKNDPLIRAARRAHGRRRGLEKSSRGLNARTLLLSVTSCGAVVVAGWLATAPAPDSGPPAPVTLTPAPDLPDQGAENDASTPRRAQAPERNAAGQDQSEEQREAADARWRALRPAYQSLAWRGDGILIDIIRVAPSGKVVLAVAYTSTKADARRGYRRFLSLHGDDGTGYVVRYLSWGSYRRLLCPDLDACRIAPRY